MKKLLSEEGSFYEYILPGATGLLQPLDTHINKYFKDRMRRKFETWYGLIGCAEANKTVKGDLWWLYGLLRHGRKFPRAWVKIRLNIVVILLLLEILFHQIFRIKFGFTKT